jgi:hypothetical protein
MLREFVDLRRIVDHHATPNRAHFRSATELLVPKIGASGCLAVVAFGLPGCTYTCRKLLSDTRRSQ